MVDAAVCIPIFVIAMVILIFIVAQCGMEMDCYHEMTLFAERTSAAVSSAESDCVGSSCELENGICIDNVMILVRHTDTKIPVPDLFQNRLQANELLAFRPFLGESRQMSDTDSAIVYVFPKRGECYHISGCPDLEEGGVQTVLTDKLRKRYHSCENCDPERLPNGAAVYMFSSASRVYHRKSCPSITKTYVAMRKSEAVQQGYRPCGHCGGGEWNR